MCTPETAQPPSSAIPTAPLCLIGASSFVQFSSGIRRPIAVPAWAEKNEYATGVRSSRSFPAGEASMTAAAQPEAKSMGSAVSRS